MNIEEFQGIEITRLQGDSSRISHCSILPDGRLLCSHDNGIIETWNLDCLCKESKFDIGEYLTGYYLKEHNICQLNNGIIATSLNSLKNSIKLWDTKSGENIGVLEGYYIESKRGNEPSLCSLIDGTLSCVSNDIIAIWDYEKRECKQTYKKHTDYIHGTGPVTGSVQLNDGRLVIYGHNLSITDIESDCHLKIMNDKIYSHSQTWFTKAFQIQNGVLVTNEYQGGIKLWDLDKYEYFYTFDTKSFDIYNFDNNKIILYKGDIFKVFDIETRKYEKIVEVGSQIRSVCNLDNMVISGMNDGSIRFFN